MNEQEQAKAATFKAIRLTIFYVILILLLLWLLRPLKGYFLAIPFVTVLFLGFCALRDIKRIIYKKPCALCGVDIYPIIFTAQNYGEVVKHCPFCGEKI